MNKTLSALGMTTAFDKSQADFNGISKSAQNESIGTAPLHFKDVLVFLLRDQRTS